MNDTVRHIQPEDRIDALYRNFDQSDDPNVIALKTGLSEKSQSLLNDVEALLQNPETRATAEKLLWKAVFEIGETHKPK